MVHSQKHLTAAEYRQLPETLQHTELIHGQVIHPEDSDMSPAPKLSHQRTVFNTAKLVDRVMPDGVVYIPPTDVELDQDVVVQPDVLWISASNTTCHEVDERFLRGAPDLVVEVLSIGTARHDKTTKFNLYQQFGVREYWIIDPVAQYIEVWVRQDEHFQHMGVFGPDEQFKSTVLDADIPLKSIFNA